MNTDDRGPLEEQLSFLLAACDEAWRKGDTPSFLNEAELPPELRHDLEADLACVQLLRQVLPRVSTAPTALPADIRVAPLTCLGRFQIRRELGRGTHGIVYLAHDSHLNREVALKVPRGDAVSDPGLLQRFEREARAAAGLDHPNIVPVYEAGAVGPVCYIASAYCPGETLAQWLRQRDQPVSVREAATLVAKLAEAVQHAHGRGVVHRDLKPGNVLLSFSCQPPANPARANTTLAGGLQLDEALPKITDFGLAKFVQEGMPGQTQSGAIVGTPSYMAPEQAGGQSKAVGPAVDVYALGAILYELLTGRPPFVAEATLDILLAVRGEEPIPPGRLRRSVPRDLETVCLKCLQKEPQRRYPMARALADDLNRWLNGEPIRARSVSVRERAWRWVKRRPIIAALWLGIVLVGAGGVAGVLWQWQRAEGEWRRAEEAHRDLQVRHYGHLIALAEREWAAGNKSRADQLLADCPVELRNWEWHYLKRLRYTEPLILRGHTSGVSSVAFSPDGQRLASVGDDRTVRIWDARTGKELRTLRGHTVRLYSVIFSSDGERLVTAGGESGQQGRRGEVRIWDVTSGETLFARDQDFGVATAVAFHTDGRRLAAMINATDAGQICLWDTRTGQELVLHGRPGFGLGFSPDGQRLAAAYANGTVTVWDVQTGQELLTLRGHTSTGHSVVFSPDGQCLASASGNIFTWDKGEVNLWDATTGQVLHACRGHSEHVWHVAFSPDGRRLASASGDQTVKLWDVVTGQEALTLRGHASQVRGVAFSPDGRRLASCSKDHTVMVWDATPLSDEQPSQELRTLHGHAGPVWHVAFSPDGRQVASASGDQTVRVWDAANGRQTRVLQGHTRAVSGVTFSADSQQVFSAGGDRTLRVWDAGTGQEVRTFLTRGSDSVALDPHGRHLAVGSMGGTVQVWDLTTGQEVLTFREHTWGVMSVAFSPDGRRLASSSADRTVLVWEAATGKVELRLEGHPDNVWCVAFSPDGRYLASAGAEGLAKVWDAATGQEVRTLTGHTGRVTSVAFSPDSRFLASASADQTVVVWEAATGKVLRTLRGHTDRVHSVAFSPDGRHLASAGYDKTVKIWDVTAPGPAHSVQGPR